MQEGFGENICQAVSCVAILQRDGSIHLLTNKIILKFNVLCISMENRIARNCKTHLIVTQDKCMALL